LERRVIAIIRDKNLLEYVDGTEGRPVAADLSAPTANETKATWVKLDGKAKSQIELALGTVSGRILQIILSKSGLRLLFRIGVQSKSSSCLTREAS
jgi:hypothetical protein